MAYLSREEGITMKKSTLKLSMCERPRVAGVTQALVPEWSGYDLDREVKNALSIYLLEDTFSERSVVTALMPQLLPTVLKRWRVQSISIRAIFALSSSFISTF